MLLSQGASINFFFWSSFLFFFLEHFYLSTRLLSHLTLESPVIFQLNVSKFLAVSSAWMINTVNKLKHMAFHVSYKSRIKASVTIFIKTFFNVPSEISSILVSHFLGKEWWNVGKKYFRKSAQNQRREGKSEEKLTQKKNRLSKILNAHFRFECKSEWIIYIDSPFLSLFDFKKIF